MDATNRTWILANRPNGEPVAETFELVEEQMPEPGPNQLLLRTIYMSVDPYMRGRMRASHSYAESWEVGAPMRARCVAEVVESNHPGIEPDELVVGNLYWSEYAVVDADRVERVDTGSLPRSTALHVLGMPGRTAYVGTVEVGHVKPGDTVVVSAAAGAVGSVAGQIAGIAGASTVGIAGSDEKVAWLREDLGFDEAINYRTSEDLSAAVADACPQGVDLYFENVGGEVSDAVLDHLTQFSRIAVCGKISLYNRESDSAEATSPQRLYQRTRTRVEGFIVHDYRPRFEQTTARLRRWVQNGDIEYRETVTDGLTRAPEAFLGLFEGENIGKQLVRVADKTD